MTRQREGARERYWRQVRELADEHSVSVPEARSMWKTYYKKGGVRRLLVSLNVVASTNEVVCPYCRDEMPTTPHQMACQTCGSFEHPEYDPDVPCEPPAIWVCNQCRTRLHQECYDELGRCTTLGCRARVVAGRVRARRRPATVQQPQVHDGPQETEQSFLEEYRWQLVGAAALISAVVTTIIVWWLLTG